MLEERYLIDNIKHAQNNKRDFKIQIKKARDLLVPLYAKIDYYQNHNGNLMTRPGTKENKSYQDSAIEEMLKERHLSEVSDEVL